MSDGAVKSGFVSYINVPLKPVDESVITSAYTDEIQDPLKLSTTPDLLICLTVYNEPREALLFSLLGLFNSLDYLENIGCEKAAELTICIIFDGFSKISPSIVSLLSRLDLWAPKEMEKNSGFHVFESTLRRPLIEDVAGDVDLSKEVSRWGKVYRDSLIEILENSIDISERVSECKVIVCIKDENAGKLNSHWCFFQMISSALEPKYCLPMDVGTVPSKVFLYELWSYMEKNPDVGAAASCTLVPELDERASLLDIWQYGSFYREKLFYWPGEAFSGYLSVIPGQFAILRWSSLTATTANSVGSHSHIGGEVRVLDRYYRGLLELSPIERNLFLAEDRVIGMEIAASNSDAWKTAFVPSAVVITDPCDNFNELMRQRRRWINSGFTARLFLFPTVLLHFIQNPSSLKDKFPLLRSILLQSGKLITEWLGPSISFMLLFTAYKQAKLACLNSSLTAYWVDVFLAGLFIFSSIIYRGFFHKDEESNVGQLLSILILFLTLWDGVSLIALAYLGNFIFLPFYIFMRLGMVLGIWVNLKLSPYHVSNMRSKLYIYYHHFLEFSFLLVLYTYAFSNVNDFSWGTKGLRNLANKKRSSGESLLWFITIPWIASNVVFIYFLLSTGGYLDGAFMLLCAIVAACYIFYMGSGLIYFTINLHKSQVH